MAFKIQENFDLVKKEKIKENNTTVLFYEHKKTKAKVMYFQNENESASFNIFFKTPLDNSKGTNHILEHSVFEGSKKYDQENSLDFIFNNSLSSFANAMTFTDKTMYIFNSSFQKDFLNLLDVYLDFVFFPKLEEKTLKKEGHFYKKTKNGYEFNGIVFNEMKESLLGFDSKFFYAVKEFFLPGSYSHNLGGNPIDIVDLTIDELRNYHKDKYHPSNSHTILYGKINKNKVFEKLNEVFSQFEYEEKNFEIKAIPVAENKKLTIEYQDYDGGDNKFVKYYLLKGMVSEEDYLGLDLIKKYYLDYDFSPLKTVIEDSGFCSSVECAILDDFIFPIFTIICKGVDHKNVENLEDLIDKSIFKFSKTIPKETKDLLLKSYEFNLKEIEFYQNQGFDIAVSVGRFLNYGLDPLIGLRNYKSLKIIEKLLKGKNLEKFLAEKFLSSQTLSIKFTPNQKLLDEYNNELQLKLEKKLKLEDFTDLDKKIEEHEKFLNREKIEPKYPSLKKIKIQDLDLKITKFDSELKENVYHTHLNSSDLYRVGLNFDISDFNFSKLEYLGIYLNLVNQLGTSKYNFREFSFLKKKYFADFNISISNYFNQKSEKKIYLISLFMKFLDSDKDEVLNVAYEFIKNTEFNNKERLKFLIEEQYQKLKDYSIQEPLVNACSKADSFMTEFDYLHYNLNFAPMINKLKFILENFDNEFDSIVTELTLIHNYIFNQTCIWNLGYSKENERNANHLIQKISDKLNIIPGEVSKLGNLTVPGFETGKSLNFYIPSNSDTSFNVMTVKYNSIDEKDKKVLSILNPYMFQYLWDNIRVKNGAYGAKFHIDKDFNFSYFYSYSDPKITETFNIYSNTKSNFNLNKFKKYAYDKMKIRFLSGYKHIYRNSEIYNLSFQYYMKDIDYKKRVSDLEAKIALNFNDFKELVRKLKDIKFVIKVIATSLDRIKDFKDSYEKIS